MSIEELYIQLKAACAKISELEQKNSRLKAELEAKMSQEDCPDCGDRALSFTCECCKSLVCSSCSLNYAKMDEFGECSRLCTSCGKTLCKNCIRFCFDCEGIGDSSPVKCKDCSSVIPYACGCWGYTCSIEHDDDNYDHCPQCIRFSLPEDRAETYKRKKKAKKEEGK